MYKQNIIINKFSDEFAASVGHTSLGYHHGEIEHVVSIFSDIDHDKPDESPRMSISEISDDLSRLAAEARSFHDISDDAVWQVKSRVPCAVFSQIDVGGKKGKKRFLNASLIAIDVDQKESVAARIFSMDDVVKLLSGWQLSAVLYTTFSHHASHPCFRIVINLGRPCGVDDYHRSCEWLKKNILAPLCNVGAVDESSWSPIYPKALPCAYRYEKPTVKLVHGYGLWERYSSQIKQIVPASWKKTSKIDKQKIGAKNTASPQAGLFVEQVGYLHKKLKFCDTKSGSVRLWRSNYDTTPGLLSREGWRLVYDPVSARKYPLQYSSNDFQEALSHQPVSRSNRVQELRDWMSSCEPYALFHENCGTGKSEVLAQLSADSPSEQRYVFTFLTIANRDAFAQKASNAITVKSTTEIISEVVDDQRCGAALEVITEYYASSNGLRQKMTQRRDSSANEWLSKFLDKELEHISHGVTATGALQKCLDEGVITNTEFNDIRNEYQKNKNKLDASNHLLMTTRKFEFLVHYTGADVFRGSVIFTDEHQLGMLTNIDPTQGSFIYGKTRYPKTYDEIDRSKLHSLKRCIVTSESIASYELNFNKIAFRKIGKVTKTPDFNTFEVLWVSSTSQVEDRDCITTRQHIKKAVEKVAGQKPVIISDGLDADFNMVTCKGSNELRNSDTVIILSLPCPQELVQVVACTGLDEEQAKSVILSDKANQSVGRNQGYRNKDQLGNPGAGENHCLLIIPKKAIEIDLHFVTPKVVNANHWFASKAWEVSDDKKERFFFRETIESVASTLKKSCEK